MIISIHENSKQNYMHILIAIWHFILFLRFAWDRLWDVEGAPGIWHFVLLLRFAWDRPWDVEGAPDIWHFVLFLRFAWDRLWDVEGSPGQIRCLSYLLQLPAITKSSQSFLCGRVRQTCHRWSHAGKSKVLLRYVLYSGMVFLPIKALTICCTF